MLQGILYILIFLVEVAIFVKARSRRIRQAALLAGSYAVYLAWGHWFAAVLIVSTVMNYLVGLWLRRDQSWRALSIGILLNAGLLSTFKYLPELAVTLPFSSLQRFAHLALPIGISFWTFQAMSYLFDQYRGEDLDPSFLEFSLYMAFFPVAISGPVCRMPEMLPQFRSEESVRWDRMERGFARIATGVLMMQVAKLLGQGILGGDGINSGFDHLTQWTGADVWCLVFGYGLQLFFDFAGYSHIAIGAASVLGIAVPENFNRPFQSTTASIFWTRWHMSLSFWIRDYVFFPLAAMRRQLWWRNLILVVSMVVFGVWHKATLLFVFWGFYHGVLLVLHRQLQTVQRKFEREPHTALWTALSWITTMALINVGWIFFRANSLREANQMLRAVLAPASYLSHFVSVSLFLLVVAVAGGYASVVVVAAVLDRYSTEPKERGLMSFLAEKRWYWVPPLYGLTLIVLLIVTLTQNASTAQFMYRAF